MKITIVLLTVLTIAGCCRDARKDRTVAEIQKNSGNEYTAERISDDCVCIKSIKTFRGIDDSPSTFHGATRESDISYYSIVVYATAVDVRQDESVSDIAIINNKLSSEINKMRNEIGMIPHRATKNTDDGAEYLPKNVEQVQLLGLYHALRKGVRHIPNAKYCGQYFYIEPHKVSFVDESGLSASDSLLITLKNL